MSQTPPQQKLLAACPHCGKTYALAPESLGRVAKCRQCEQSFTIAPAPPPGVPSAPPTAAGETLCPVCQAAVRPDESITSCPRCHSPHHQDCWEYNRGCGLYGCQEAPETEKLREIEIPASFWGQTEKKCPNCQQTIQAAAVRCRHCGTEFQNARPTDHLEFRSAQALKKSLPMHRNVGVILLIAAVIPCTAPLAAVVGIIWYLLARRQIATLPPLQATICRIAVGLAVAVTVTILLMASIYSAMH